VARSLSVRPLDRREGAAAWRRKFPSLSPPLPGMTVRLSRLREVLAMDDHRPCDLSGCGDRRADIGAGDVGPRHVHNGLSRTRCADKISIRSSSRQPRDAMFMRCSTKKRIFPASSISMPSLTGCASCLRPTSLKSPNAARGRSSTLIRPGGHVRKRRLVWFAGHHLPPLIGCSGKFTRRPC
jgi:hypothetical protein